MEFQKAETNYRHAVGRFLLLDERAGMDEAYDGYVSALKILREDMKDTSCIPGLLIELSPPEDYRRTRHWTEL